MSASFLVVICWLAMGALTAYLAQKRGKNPFLWFFIGVFLGVLGILILFMLPVKKVGQPEPEPLSAPSYQEPPLQEDLSSDMDISKKRLSKNPSIHWYFIDSDKKRQGPFKFEEIKTAYSKGTLLSSTLLWNEELDGWTFLKDFSNYDFVLQD